MIGQVYKLKTNRMPSSSRDKLTFRSQLKSFRAWGLSKQSIAHPNMLLINVQPFTTISWIRFYFKINQLMALESWNNNLFQKRFHNAIDIELFLISFSMECFCVLTTPLQGLSSFWGFQNNTSDGILASSLITFSSTFETQFFFLAFLSI